MALSNATELADWGSGIGTGPLQVDNVNKRIGIGTTAPLAQTDIFNQTGVTTTLLVRQVGDYDILRLEDRLTPDYSPFIVKSTGRTGIGTDNPTAPLFVRGNDNTLGILTSTTNGANIDLWDNDTQSRIRTVDGRLHLYSDFNSAVADSSIRFFVDGTNEKVRIDSSGNFGIGTDDPQKTLNVVAGVGTTEFIRLSQPVDASVQQNFGIGWCSNNDHLWPGAQITSMEFDVSDPRRDLVFYTRGTNEDIGPTERLRIQYDGYVGIGTSAADRPLHVYDSTNSIFFVESADTNADIIQADTGGSTRVRSYSGDMLIFTHGDVSSANADNSVLAVRINKNGQVGLGSHSPQVKLDIREIKEGADVQIRVFNTDHSATNTQTASINLSPDSRALAGTGLKALKENLDFTTSGSRDVSMAFNTVLNNSQNERMRLNSSGQLGIGQTLPYGKLHVKEGASGATTANGSADTLFLENDANAGLSIATPNSNTGYLTFADPEDDNVGMLIYRHDHGTNPNSMAFFVNTAERMNIDAYGRVLIGITSAMNTGSNDHRDTLQVVDTAGGQLLLGRNDTSAAISNRIGEVAALGNDSDGTYEPCASIRFEVDATHSTGDKSTAIIFKTCKDGTDDLYERVRISNFGGIGLAGGHVGAASTDFGRDNQVLASDGSSSAVQWRYVNTPCWFGSQDTQHTIDTATWTDIINLGNTVTNVDCHGGWDESTGTFTVPADSGGIYYLFGQAGIDDVQDSDVVRAGISINGANPSFFAEQRCIDQGANVVVPSGLTSRVADLSAGDTVNLMVYHNEGTSEVTEPNRTFFGGYRLSAHP